MTFLGCAEENLPVDENAVESELQDELHKLRLYLLAGILAFVIRRQDGQAVDRSVIHVCGLRNSGCGVVKRGASRKRNDQRLEAALSSDGDIE